MAGCTISMLAFTMAMEVSATIQGVLQHRDITGQSGKTALDNTSARLTKASLLLFS